MDRRDLSIILIFLMLAVGGGLPNALHWKVDHGCCGAACAIVETQQTAARHFDCCPHPHHQHHHAQDERSDDAAQDSDALVEAYDESSDASASTDLLAAIDPVDEHPLSDHHDCSICQFLATLAAVVSPTIITPVHFDSIEWRIGEPFTAAAQLDRASSHGPRAPPRFNS